MMKWKDYPPGFPEYDAYELACRIEDCYEKNKVYIKIHKSGKVPLYGDGYKFEVNLRKSDASIGKIEKLTQDVQFMLKLPTLQAVRENGVLYIITATLSEQSLNNNLLQIMGTDEYKSALESMSIAHPVGVTQDGKVKICDLVDYPHAMVSGASKSGKSTALKCLLVSLLRYSPDKMNLLIAERGIAFTKFASLPHLSHPIIYTPEDLAAAFLLLSDEMERRTVLERENEGSLEKLPYIVCVIDEFSRFIKKISKDKKTEDVVETINDILRYGRNVKIHLVLSIHDPKDEIAIIQKSDLLVILVFQTTNARKSMNVLDVAGAERLKGKGDMIFRHEGQHHLQGVDVSDDEIESVIQAVKGNEFDSEFPRGEFGFSISDEDIETKKAEIIQAVTTSPLSNGINNKDSADPDELFSRVTIWVLSQTSVSINNIQISGLIPNNYGVASKIHQRLCEYGVLGNEKDRYSRQKVSPKSIEDISDSLKEILNRYGYSDADILAAISKRPEQ